MRSASLNFDELLTIPKRTKVVHDDDQMMEYADAFQLTRSSSIHLTRSSSKFFRDADDDVFGSVQVGALEQLHAWLTMIAGSSPQVQEVNRSRYFDFPSYSPKRQHSYPTLLEPAHATTSEEGSVVQEAASDALNQMLVHDAELVWRDVELGLADEELLERLQWQFDAFLARHGNAGVRALSALILGRLPSSEVSWTLLRMIGNSRDPRTAEVRRDIVAAALESRDAGIRYAATSALGGFSDEFAIEVLKKRLKWEKNLSVRRMIEAELRR
jgi:hypothetical protein